LQLRVRHIARNVMSNWLATAANMAVSFFLAPFVVRHLGTVAYGVWVLAISAVNYLGLLDMGMRGYVLRYVSKGRTTGEHHIASDAISTTLWVRFQISAVVLLLSGVLATAFPYMFRIPPELAHDARIAVMIIGFNMAFTLSVGVFGGVVSGLNRYDLQSLVTLIQLGIRATGVILVLRSGYGIVAIALCECMAAIISNSLLFVIGRRLYPELKIRLTIPDRQRFRQLWSYSWYAFVVTIAVQLVYQTDNLVVGAFVSAAAVTYYSIGNSLCRYADQLVGAMGVTFVPAASTYESAGDTSRLMGLYRHGTRAVMSISLPVLVTLMTRGKTFIGLWMGPQFSQSSGKVLMILATALFFSLANTTPSAIAYGLEKHRILARWAIIEAIANLTLSIILARKFGLYGVAIGTLVPSLFVHLFLWPTVISRAIGLGGPRVVWGVWGPMFLSAVPFAIASYAVNLVFPPRNLFIFLLQTVALLPVFFLTVAIIFRGYVRSQIVPRMHHLLRRVPAEIR
jgi:O-antigen/teichoic acid export membrane protein